jgi:hypothetical protein
LCVSLHAAFHFVVSFCYTQTRRPPMWYYLSYKNTIAIVEYLDVCIVSDESMSAWSEVVENKRVLSHTRICVCNSLRGKLSSWLCCILIHVPCIFIIFIITNKCTFSIIKVYITTVALSNLYCYMFRHFHVIIREFKTNAFPSYKLSLNCTCWKYNL